MRHKFRLMRVMIWHRAVALLPASVRSESARMQISAINCGSYSQIPARGVRRWQRPAPTSSGVLSNICVAVCLSSSIFGYKPINRPSWGHAWQALCNSTPGSIFAAAACNLHFKGDSCASVLPMDPKGRCAAFGHVLFRMADRRS